MDWTTVVLDALTLMLDVLTLLIVIASFKAIRDNRKQSEATLTVAREQIEESRKQAQQERFAEHRPLLVPDGKPKFQDDKPLFLDWNANEQRIVIRNIGSGVALNIASVLYGGESYYLDWNTNLDDTKDTHWTCWLGVPLQHDQKEAIHKKGNGKFYENKKHIGQYSFNAPPQPRPSPHQDQLNKTARITITYLDIFRRKHASIFDYVQQTDGWQVVAYLEDISEDLYDLQGA